MGTHRGNPLLLLAAAVLGITAGVLVVMGALDASVNHMYAAAGVAAFAILANVAYMYSRHRANCSSNREIKQKPPQQQQQQQRTVGIAAHR
jgi:membrane protein implicated in regulation of membrane protease activity